MTDKYQAVARQIMYDAMLCLRVLNPGTYNRSESVSSIGVLELLALNSAIGDGLHNIPAIMVADIGETERGEVLRRELVGFSSELSGLDIPSDMPQPWTSLVRTIQNELSA
jgi:hypothetical protein